MKDWEKLPQKLQNVSHSVNQTCNELCNLPAIYRGIFYDNTKTLDSFLYLNSFRKGVAYLNGNCLGRYWPKLGPQVSLYTPGFWFNKNYKNEIILFELNGNSQISWVKFMKEPYIDSPTPCSSKAKI